MKLSAAEDADVREIAATWGMKPGAWIAEVAVRQARGQLRPVSADWRDALGQVVAARTDVIRVGTLLNQLAAHANSTGSFAPETARMLAMCERMLHAIAVVESAAAAKARRAR